LLRSGRSSWRGQKAAADLGAADEMKNKPWLLVQPWKRRQQMDLLLAQLKDLPDRRRQYASQENVKKEEEAEGTEEGAGPEGGAAAKVLVELAALQDEEVGF
jgi:hypothetical protein